VHLVFGQVHQGIFTHHQKPNQSRTRAYHQPCLITDDGATHLLLFSCFLNPFQNPTLAIVTVCTTITLPIHFDYLPSDHHCSPIRLRAHCALVLRLRHIWIIW
jgi:hypothetical protein